MTFVYVMLAIASFAIVLLIFERDRLLYDDLMPPWQILAGAVLVWVALRFVFYRADLHWPYLKLLGIATVIWLIYHLAIALFGNGNPPKVD